MSSKKEIRKTTADVEAEAELFDQISVFMNNLSNPLPVREGATRCYLLLAVQDDAEELTGRLIHIDPDAPDDGDVFESNPARSAMGLVNIKLSKVFREALDAASQIAAVRAAAGEERFSRLMDEVRKEAAGAKS